LCGKRRELYSRIDLVAKRRKVLAHSLMERAVTTGISSLSLPALLKPLNDMDASLVEPYDQLKHLESHQYLQYRQSTALHIPVSPGYGDGRLENIVHRAKFTRSGSDLGLLEVKLGNSWLLGLSPAH
jgi:hypothetical protein